MDLDKLPVIVDTHRLTPDNVEDIANMVDKLFQNSSCVEVVKASPRTKGKWTHDKYLRYDKTHHHAGEDNSSVKIWFFRSDDDSSFLCLQSKNDVRIGFPYIDGRKAVYFSTQDLNYDQVNPFFRYQCLLTDSNADINSAKNKK